MWTSTGHNEDSSRVGVPLLFVALAEADLAEVLSSN